MHSSRVRTARLLTVSEGVCIGGRSALGRGLHPGGGGLHPGEGGLHPGGGGLHPGRLGRPPEQNDRQV